MQAHESHESKNEAGDNRPAGTGKYTEHSHQENGDEPPLAHQMAGESVHMRQQDHQTDVSVVEGLDE